MFNTLIVQPIFNLLVLIYSLLPGHNFGLAIIIFTVLIRLAMWPLVKKQINHAKAMRELAPEIKKIKAAAKGDRQKESAMTMELYKEREINPFASLGIVLVQLPILLGLYASLNKIIHNPHVLVTFTYPAVRHLAWMQDISHNIHDFDNTLLGFVDLTRSAVGPHGVYAVGLLIAGASAFAQFYQSKQLMPQSKDSRSLRSILRDASKGKSADQSEVNAAVGKGTMYLIPFMVLILAIRLPLALPLYWLTSSCVAIFQQGRLLRSDASEADDSVSLVETKPAGAKKVQSKSQSKKSSRNKRKKR